MTQISGYSVDTWPTATLGAAGINIQHCIPSLPLLTRFHICRCRIILNAVFTAKYVKVTENNTRDIRRSVRVCVSTFTLKKIASKISS